MQLYLLRHGDAFKEGFDDARRSLSPLGEEQINLAASLLKKLNVSIDVVFSSPLIRAKQSADIVNRKLQVHELIETEYLAPGSDHRRLLGELNKQSYNSILLVGHEPQLSTLISLLISGTRSVRVAVSKGGLAYLESPFPLQWGQAKICWLLIPECMQV